VCARARARTNTRTRATHTHPHNTTHNNNTYRVELDAQVVEHDEADVHDRDGQRARERQALGLKGAGGRKGGHADGGERAVQPRQRDGKGEAIGVEHRLVGEHDRDDGREVDDAVRGGQQPRARGALLLLLLLLRGFGRAAGERADRARAVAAGRHDVDCRRRHADELLAALFGGHRRRGHLRGKQHALARLAGRVCPNDDRRRQLWLLGVL
jgi:hypothetical protein